MVGSFTNKANLKMHVNDKLGQVSQAKQDFNVCF